MGVAIVGFGANLGSPGKAFEAVLARLNGDSSIQSSVASQLICTTPVGGPPNQPRYHNAAIRVETSRPAHLFFEELQRLETDLGRVREAQWGPRAIDLDLLLFDELQIKRPELTIPHPRFHFRKFALAPAAEVAGEMRHPIFGLSIQTLLARLDRLPRITAIAGPDQKAAGMWAEVIARRTGAELIEKPSERKRRLPKELVTVWDGDAPEGLPPQLVLWIGTPEENPEQLIERLRRTQFSTWSVIDPGREEFARMEAEAAVVAMRPFESE